MSTTHTVYLKGSVHSIIKSESADWAHETVKRGRGTRSVFELQIEELRDMIEVLETKANHASSKRDREDCKAASERLTLELPAKPAKKVKKAKKTPKKKSSKKPARKPAKETPKELTQDDVDFGLVECPQCTKTAEGNTEITDLFGWRKMTYRGGKTRVRPQSYCRKCKYANRKMAIAARKRLANPDDKNLTETLSDAGFSHVPADNVTLTGCHHVIDKKGNTVFTGRAHDIWVWLNMPEKAKASKKSNKKSMKDLNKVLTDRIGDALGFG